MRKLLALAALAALTACGGSDEKTITGTTNASVNGAYSLTTVNGKALPFVVQQDASTTRSLTSAELNLGSDGTWTEVQLYRTTGTGTAATTSSYTMSGTYTVSGNTAALTMTGGGSGTLNFTADPTTKTLSMTESGTTYVFTRAF